ncbi:MAG TPA: OmpA family protein [Chryseosolibacter sp.]
MKKLLLANFIGIVTVFSLVSFSGREAHYYVVIGAFAKESNAIKFTGYARNRYLDAFYKYNAERKLYYVHAMETGRKDEARNWTLYLQHEKGFRDAWVFTSPAVVGDVSGVLLTEAPAETEARYSGNRDIPHSDYGDIASASGSDNIVNYAREHDQASGMEAEWTHIDGLSFLAGMKGAASVRKNAAMPGNKVLTFVVETGEGKSISTEVMMVDYRKAQKLAGFTTGDIIGLRSSKQNPSITVVCDVFGYGVETKTLNLNSLSRARDVKQNAEGVWEVRFKLKPMKENEISILYNTTFFTDAAVLEPSSKKQLDQVLSLMKANPSYKILIHSHCNKGSRRTIKLAGKGGSCFDISTSVEKTGSDKTLTKARGETIKSYLVGNGIDSKRIGVFGWGSLDNLVNPASGNAAINDRVEVELVHS